jgi:hypothetical protein
MARRTLALLALLVLASALPAAAGEVVYAGLDGYRTVAERTYTDFERNPIPAGFFCPTSPAFTGKVRFRGLPIATTPANALDGADTVFARLDDATFDARGVAETRLQMQALSLVSTEPIKTGCGKYLVYVTLHGEQPISPAHHMRITKDNPLGGYFLAEFRIQYKLTFVPLNAARAQLELVRTSLFVAGSDHRWVMGETTKAASAVRVDTNNDGLPDRDLAGPSNFLAGKKAEAQLARYGAAAVDTKIELINDRELDSTGDDCSWHVVE